MKRYFLDQDNSGHWYLVDASKRRAWVKWSNLPSDDEAGWIEPDYAQRLNGGPSRVTFSDPKEGG